MNRYYCIKCRKKLKFDSSTNWYPEFTETITKLLYSNYSAWICKSCNLAYVFLNSSGNENTILTLIHLKDYLERDTPDYGLKKDKEESD